MMGRLIQSCGAVALSAAAFFGLSADVKAQDAAKPADTKPVEHAIKGGETHEHEKVNSGALTLSGGVDFTNAYYFRGIGQENQGFILQPYATLTMLLTDNLNISFGTWNSFHGGPTGDDAAPGSTQANGSDMQSWYESDFIVGINATFDKFSASLTYTAYASPNDSFNTVQEIAIRVGYDDTGLLPVKLSPYALIAFETSDDADAGNSAFGVLGTSSGIYLELGIAPGFTLIDSKTMPVSVSFPIAAGFSLDDYYEAVQAAGLDDEFYGYLSLGVNFTMPLAFIPAKFGSWSLVVGGSVLFLGDTTDTLNGVGGNDDVEFIGKVGLSFAY